MEVFIMNDEEMIRGLRTVVMGVIAILMVITVVLQLLAFRALRHAILCSFILLLISVTLIFDGILKDSKEMAFHGSWYALWFLCLIMTILSIQSLKKEFILFLERGFFFYSSNPCYRLIIFSIISLPCILHIYFKTFV